MTSISRATRNIFGSVPMLAVHCHRVYLVLYFPSRLCVSFSIFKWQIVIGRMRQREKNKSAIFLSPFSTAFARLSHIYASIVNNERAKPKVHITLERVRWCIEVNTIFDTKSSRSKSGVPVEYYLRFFLASDGAFCFVCLLKNTTRVLANV